MLERMSWIGLALGILVVGATGQVPVRTFSTTKGRIPVSTSCPRGTCANDDSNPTVTQSNVTNTTTFSGTVAARTTNGVKNAFLEPGATADAQINSAYAALPKGGTIDARMYGATTQTFASTLMIGDGIHSWTLICDPGTKFQPSNDSMVMFIQRAGVQISGCTFDTNNQPTFSGTVLQLGERGHESDPMPYVRGPYTYGRLPGTTTDYSPATSVDSVTINMAASGTGHGIDLLSSGRGAYIEFVSFSNITVRSPGPCLYAETATKVLPGWINANSFVNFVCANTVPGAVGLLFNSPNGAVGGPTISSNQFTNFNYEGGGLSSITAIKSIGAGHFEDNVWSNSAVWDTTKGTSLDFGSGPNSRNNNFYGTLHGAPYNLNLCHGNSLWDQSSRVIITPGCLEIDGSGNITSPRSINSKQLTVGEGESSSISSTSSDYAPSISSVGLQGISVTSNHAGTATSEKVTNYSTVWTPAPLTASTCAEQTLSVTGLVATRAISITPPAALSHVWIGSARVSAADTLAVEFCADATGGTPPGGNWLFTQ